MRRSRRTGGSSVLAGRLVYNGDGIENSTINSVGKINEDPQMKQTSPWSGARPPLGDSRAISNPQLISPSESHVESRKSGRRSRSRSLLSRLWRRSSRQTGDRLEGSDAASNSEGLESFNGCMRQGSESFQNGSHACLDNNVKPENSSQLTSESVFLTSSDDNNLNTSCYYSTKSEATHAFRYRSSRWQNNVDKIIKTECDIPEFVFQKINSPPNPKSPLRLRPELYPVRGSPWQFVEEHEPSSPCAESSFRNKRKEDSGSQSEIQYIDFKNIINKTGESQHFQNSVICKMSDSKLSAASMHMVPRTIRRPVRRVEDSAGPKSESPSSDDSRDSPKSEDNQESGIKQEFETSPRSNWQLKIDCLRETKIEDPNSEVHSSEAADADISENVDLIPLKSDSCTQSSVLKSELESPAGDKQTTIRALMDSLPIDKYAVDGLALCVDELKKKLSSKNSTSKSADTSSVECAGLVGKPAANDCVMASCYDTVKTKFDDTNADVSSRGATESSVQPGPDGKLIPIIKTESSSPGKLSAGATVEAVENDFCKSLRPPQASLLRLPRDQQSSISCPNELPKHDEQPDYVSENSAEPGQDRLQVVSAAARVNLNSNFRKQQFLDMPFAIETSSQDSSACNSPVHQPKCAAELFALATQNHNAEAQDGELDNVVASSEAGDISDGRPLGEPKDEDHIEMGITCISQEGRERVTNEDSPLLEYLEKMKQVAIEKNSAHQPELCSSVPLQNKDILNEKIPQNDESISHPVPSRRAFGIDLDIHRIMIGPLSGYQQCKMDVHRANPLYQDPWVDQSSSEEDEISLTHKLRDESRLDEIVKLAGSQRNDVARCNLEAMMDTDRFSSDENRISNLSSQCQPDTSHLCGVRLGNEDNEKANKNTADAVDEIHEFNMSESLMYSTFSLRLSESGISPTHSGSPECPAGLTSDIEDDLSKKDQKSNQCEQQTQMEPFSAFAGLAAHSRHCRTSAGEIAANKYSLISTESLEKSEAFKPARNNPKKDINSVLTRNDFRLDRTGDQSGNYPQTQDDSQRAHCWIAAANGYKTLAQFQEEQSSKSDKECDCNNELDILEEEGIKQQQQDTFREVSSSDVDSSDVHADDYDDMQYNPSSKHSSESVQREWSAKVHEQIIRRMKGSMFPDYYPRVAIGQEDQKDRTCLKDIQVTRYDAANKIIKSESSKWDEEQRCAQSGKNDTVNNEASEEIERSIFPSSELLDNAQQAHSCSPDNSESYGSMDRGYRAIFSKAQKKLAVRSNLYPEESQVSQRRFQSNFQRENSVESAYPVPNPTNDEMFTQPNCLVSGEFDHQEFQRAQSLMDHRYMQYSPYYETYDNFSRRLIPSQKLKVQKSRCMNMRSHGQINPYQNGSQHREYSQNIDRNERHECTQENLRNDFGKNSNQRDSFLSQNYHQRRCDDINRVNYNDGFLDSSSYRSTGGMSNSELCQFVLPGDSMPIQSQFYMNRSASSQSSIPYLARGQDKGTTRDIQNMYRARDIASAHCNQAPGYSIDSSFLYNNGYAHRNMFNVENPKLYPVVGPEAPELSSSSDQYDESESEDSPPRNTPSIAMSGEFENPSTMWLISPSGRSLCISPHGQYQNSASIPSERLPGIEPPQILKNDKGCSPGGDTRSHRSTSPLIQTGNQNSEDGSRNDKIWISRSIGSSESSEISSGTSPSSTDARNRSHPKACGEINSDDRAQRVRKSQEMRIHHEDDPQLVRVANMSEQVAIRIIIKFLKHCVMRKRLRKIKLIVTSAKVIQRWWRGILKIKYSRIEVMAEERRDRDMRYLAAEQFEQKNCEPTSLESVRSKSSESTTEWQYVHDQTCQRREESVKVVSGNVATAYTCGHHSECDIDSRQSHSTINNSENMYNQKTLEELYSDRITSCEPQLANRPTSTSSYISIATNTDTDEKRYYNPDKDIHIKDKETNISREQPANRLRPVGITRDSRGYRRDIGGGVHDEESVRHPSLLASHSNLRESSRFISDSKWNLESRPEESIESIKNGFEKQVSVLNMARGSDFGYSEHFESIVNSEDGVQPVVQNTAAHNNGRNCETNKVDNNNNNEVNDVDIHRQTTATVSEGDHILPRTEGCDDENSADSIRKEPNGDLINRQNSLSAIPSNGYPHKVEAVTSTRVKEVPDKNSLKVSNENSNVIISHPDSHEHPRTHFDCRKRSDAKKTKSASPPKRQRKKFSYLKRKSEAVVDKNMKLSFDHVKPKLYDNVYRPHTAGKNPDTPNCTSNHKVNICGVSDENLRSAGPNMSPCIIRTPWRNPNAIDCQPKGRKSDTKRNSNEDTVSNPKTPLQPAARFSTSLSSGRRSNLGNSQARLAAPLNVGKPTATLDRPKTGGMIAETGIASAGLSWSVERLDRVQVSDSCKENREFDNFDKSNKEVMTHDGVHKYSTATAGGAIRRARDTADRISELSSGSKYGSVASVNCHEGKSQQEIKKISEKFFQEGNKRISVCSQIRREQKMEDESNEFIINPRFPLIRRA